MFERLTDRGRNVMAQATQEAQRLNHETIGTEHILLAILKQESGAGTHVLHKLGIDLAKTRLDVEQLMNAVPRSVGDPEALPDTPRAKKVIEFAILAARELGHNYVGTEHLLLGILRERQGAGAKALAQLGVSIDGVRKCIIEMYAAGPRPDHAVSGTPFELPQTLSFMTLPKGRASLTNEKKEWVSGPMRVELAQEIVRRYNACPPSPDR